MNMIMKEEVLVLIFGNILLVVLACCCFKRLCEFGVNFCVWKKERRNPDAPHFRRSGGISYNSKTKKLEVVNKGHLVYPFCRLQVKDVILFALTTLVLYWLYFC